MIGFALSLGLALAAPAAPCGSVADDIEAVRTQGREEAYRCLAGADPAGPALVAWLADPPVEGAGAERVQRALALHVLHRLDLPADVPALRLLSAADRRLLRDAVHARRGRRSPSAAHDRVFAQFDWYAPDAGYTNARLTGLDRENLALIDDPPAPAPPVPDTEPAAAAVANAAPPAAAQVDAWCGCGAGVGGAGSAALVLALAPLLMRRRHGPCGCAPRVRSCVHPRETP